VDDLDLILRIADEAQRHASVTRDEFEAANPHAWKSGWKSGERSSAFDSLPDDAEVWAFHGTDDATADAFVREGVDPERKPSTMARRRFEAGEDATFAPGAGLGDGLYVGTDPHNVNGYGRRIVGIKVRKGDVVPSPEQRRLGVKTAGPAMAVSDAMVRGRIPPERIVDVSSSFNEPAYEALSKVGRFIDRHAELNPYEHFEAAIWHPKHGIHLGGTHPFAIMQAMKKGIDLSDDARAVDGFYDHRSGRFHTRHDVQSMLKGSSGIPESSVLRTRGSLEAQNATDDDDEVDFDEVNDRQMRILEQGGADEDSADGLAVSRWRKPKHKVGGPDWNREVTRHALTGQSAVCDKRVARPPEDRDLDEVLENADRHMGAVQDWSIGRLGTDAFKVTNADLRKDGAMMFLRGDGKLYRGAPLRSIPQEGAVHSWGRTVAATKKRRVAIDEDFVGTGMAKHGLHPTFWEIEDAEGADLSDHPQHAYPDQAEVVLPEDHRLFVNRVRWKGKGVPGADPSGYWHVHARHLRAGEYADSPTIPLDGSSVGDFTERHAEPGHRIREDQGDGHRIDTPHGFIQYRPTRDANEVWWIESHKRDHGRELMRLMLEHHPHDAVAWGATSAAGQDFRQRWHQANPHVSDATGGQREPFEGQFDPFGHDDTPEDDFDDGEDYADATPGIEDWIQGNRPDLGKISQLTPDGQILRELKQRPQFRGTLHRGTTVREPPRKGTVVDLPNWTSATDDRATAATFATIAHIAATGDFTKEPDRKIPVIWNIADGRGSDLRDIEHPEFGAEREVVMPAGSRLLVRKVRPSSHTGLRGEPALEVDAEQLYRDIVDLQRHADKPEGGINDWTVGYPALVRPPELGGKLKPRILKELKQAPDYTGALYRGEILDELPAPGSTHVIEDWRSASTNPEVAKRFQDNRGEAARGRMADHAKKPVRWIVNQGKAKDIRDNPQNRLPWEDEVVLPAGSKLLVKKVRQTQEPKKAEFLGVPELGRWDIEAEQLYRDLELLDRPE
jgi:hypothetical protein